MRHLTAALVLLALGCGAAATDGPSDPPSTPGTPTNPGTPTTPGTTTPPTLQRTVIAAGLQNPWDVAVHSDGAIFYTEKCRGLSVRRADGSTTRLFGTSGSALVASDFFCQGQSGMHGVALDPQFATNRTIYVFMPSTLGGPPRANRIVRLVLNDGYTSAGSRTDIVTGLAYKDIELDVGGLGAHSGGRIRFGPDGYLYITTGDNHTFDLPQHPTRLGGKVLRVTRDGAAAPGNNPPAGFDARIYTYGHRNPQGISFRPGTGQSFTSEHGPNHSDEVTPLVAGGNAGWDPQNRPSLQCQGNYCGYSGSPTTMPMTDTQRFPNAMRPSWTNNNDSQGMGPLLFLGGTQWKGWEGKLLVSLMGDFRADLLTLDTNGIAIARETVSLPRTRMRALTQGPDGNLYVTTDDGELWRVVPQ